MTITTITTPRPAARPRHRLRRVLLGSAAVAATATIGFGAAAAPASAAWNNPCATAWAIFRAHMNEARFWLGAADQLAGAGNDASAELATIEANHFLALAEGALGEVSAEC
jgi:hypothetical protein